MPKMTFFKKPKLNVVLAAATLIISVSAQASQEDIDSEITRYISVLQGPNLQHQRQALEKLSWSGILSQKVYDIVEKNLLNLKDSKDKFEQQTASWYAKALGFSGMEQYRSTLRAVAKNAKSKKVKKYADVGLESLDQYKLWNPVISKNDVSAPTGRLLESRVSSMLAADDYWLVRLGAKRIYHAHKQDAELVNKAAERLENDFLTVDKKNKAQVDAVSWLIKVLAESGDPKYKPLLNTVSKQAKVKKIKKYAKKYAAYL